MDKSSVLREKHVPRLSPPATHIPQHGSQQSWWAPVASCIACWIDGSYLCWCLRRRSNVLFLNSIEQGAADRTATYTCRRECCDLTNVVVMLSICIPDELESKNVVLGRLHQSELLSQKSYKHASATYMMLSMPNAYDMNSVV